MVIGRIEIADTNCSPILGMYCCVSYQNLAKHRKKSLARERAGIIQELK